MKPLMENSRGYIACGLWVASLTIMVFGTAIYERIGDVTGLAWGVFTGLAACVFTGWAIMRFYSADNTSVERMFEVVDMLHEGRRDVARLR